MGGSPGAFRQRGSRSGRPAPGARTPRSRYVIAFMERYVGAPVTLEELAHKPGGRLTLRAQGPGGSAVVKLYSDDGVIGAAARIAALSAGPPEPDVPRVLAVDPDRRMLVLSEVRGRPLREAILGSDEAACRRAGTTLAAWHAAWAGQTPSALSAHTVERELGALIDKAVLAPRHIRLGVSAAIQSFRDAWNPVTAVHRNLSEDRVLLGERVGLVDLDEAALGPPELDVGSLLAHLDLLELRSRRDLALPGEWILEGYAAQGELDPQLLDRCRSLARFRLACIHAESRLMAA